MTYQTENEIFENIRTFWKKYSNLITYIIIFLLGSMLFWKWWVNRTYSLLEGSSIMYNEVLNGYFSDDEKYFSANANKLLVEYSNTIYADFTRMLLAKKSLEAKAVDEAKKYLIQVVKQSKQKNVADIAKIRLARIYINENKLNEALEAIANISNKHLISYAHEIRGDIYVQNKKIAEAQAEYQLAISTRQQVTPDLDKILRYKLANLPTNK